MCFPIVPVIGHLTSLHLKMYIFSIFIFLYQICCLSGFIQTPYVPTVSILFSIFHRGILHTLSPLKWCPGLSTISSSCLSMSFVIVKNVMRWFRLAVVIAVLPPFLWLQLRSSLSGPQPILTLLFIVCGQFWKASCNCPVIVLVRPDYLISPIPTISGKHCPVRHLGRLPMKDFN